MSTQPRQVISANGMRASESRVINGSRVTSILLCNTSLVRRARDRYECSQHCSGGIAPGSAYIEELDNGSRMTGTRTCVPCAEVIGLAVTGEDGLDWWPPV